MKSVKNIFNRPHVSIIVPCYNASETIKICLESITSQTLHNIEILCIDDGSTDNTPDIITMYSRRDKRIKLIKHSENMGTSTARNSGLEIARGEYIGFVDSDDYVDYNFFEKLYRAAHGTKSDIARAEQKIHYPDETIDEPIPNSKIRDKYDFYMTFSSAVYRRTMLKTNDIKFYTSLPFGADTVFLSQCVFCANKLILVHDTYYNKFILATSTSNQTMMNMSSEEIAWCIDGYKKLLKWGLAQYATREQFQYIYLQSTRLTSWLAGCNITHDDEKKIINTLHWLEDFTRNSQLTLRI